MTTDAAATPPPAQVPPPSSPDLQHLVTIVTLVVVVTALFLAREVLVPVTLAILLSFLLAPLVGVFRHLKLPRTPAVLVAVVMALGVILLLGGLIGVQVAGLARDIGRYQGTIAQKVDTVQSSVLDRLTGLVGRVGHVGENKPASEGAARPGGAAPPATPGLVPGDDRRPVPVQVQGDAISPIQLARQVLSPVLGPLETAFIVFIVTVFILLQQADLRDRLIRLFGSNDLHRTTVALDDAGARLSKYFLAQLAINTSFGVLICIGLFFIGVPSPLLWGILAALFRFVPYIGPLLAAVLPMALAAAVEPGWTMLIWTGALFFVTEPLIGQVVEPMVYGHSTGLSPVAVIVAAIFWTWLWGPVGLILSTPLTLCLVVLGRHVERLEFLDVLLGDRPALTPAENFYQRMLAGDADEAEAQAELLLEERAISSYYDEVALKGLQLAANDVARGVIPAGKLTRLRDTARELIHALGQHKDVDPPAKSGKTAVEEQSAAEKAIPRRPAPTAVIPQLGSRTGEWNSATPVLCLAGKGPLDDAASAMLAQLLEHHGLGTRVATHEKASRTQITTLDLSGVAIVCVSYLDLSGNPAQLRYLLRRLRQRAPDVRLMVGLWPAEDPFLTSEEARRTLGADLYVSSLNEAVTACLIAAGAPQS